MPDAPLDDGGPVKSALRVLLVAEVLTEHDRGLSFPQLRTHLGIPKSSLFGILRTMTARGHLLFDEHTRRYRIGVRYWEAGQAFLRNRDLPTVARPYLEAASAELGETVQLAILDGMENVYIAKADGEQRLQLVSRVGARLPAYATGLGKVLLADLDEGELRRRLATTELEPFTANTLADEERLLAELARTRERGYGIDDGEYTPGVFCVAVPVRDHQARTVAAMSCSVPHVRLTSGHHRRMVDTLAGHAEGLSLVLGGPEAGPAVSA